MRKVITVGLAAIALAGCSNPKQANKGNFERAINRFLATVPACLDAPQGTYLPASTPDRDKAPAFPAFVAVPSGQAFTQKMQVEFAKAMDALVAAGLLQKSGPKPLLGHDYANSAVSTSQVYEYDLTSAGKAAFADHPAKGFFGTRHQSFCYGTPEVLAISRYTEPGNAGGQMISQVEYTFHLKSQPHWATNPAVVSAFPSLASTTGDKMSGSTVLVLTNEGWADLREKN